MPFVLGLHTTTVMTLAGVVITGIYLHSFSILFIIPVGAILAGMGCVTGVYWGLVRTLSPHRGRQVSAFKLAITD